MADWVGTWKRRKADPIYARGLKASAAVAIDRSQRSYLSGQLLNFRTGRLHDSLSFDAPKMPGSGPFIYYGSDHPGAGPLHFGWPAHNMPARPFLELAAGDSLPQFAEIFATEFERGLDAAPQ